MGVFGGEDMKRLLLSLLGGAVLISGAPAKAQTQTTDPQATVDSVTVRATNRTDLVGFVRAASALSSDGQISRRPNRLCPLVSGAPVEVNTYVASRIRGVGAQVGVQFENRACRPNLLVLFSREPQVMLQKARDRRKIHFEPATPVQIQRFMANPQPIRWWNSVVVIPSWGSASVVGDPDAAPEIRSPGSRIKQPTRSAIQGSLIVVDAGQVDGVEVGAITDYIALVSLTDIKPEADLTGYNSILNFFAPGPPDGAAKRLTAFDLAYLRGFYSVRDDGSGLTQVGRIATAMAGELER